MTSFGCLITITCFVIVCTLDEVQQKSKEVVGSSKWNNKKTNIPLLPIDIEDKAASFLKYNGKHPVVHEYVSDHPLSGAEKRRRIPRNGDPYASISNYNLNKKTLTGQSSGKLDKRFEIYPKWFSNKVPSILGKSFSRSYFYPFGGNSNKVARSRDNIARSNIIQTSKSNAHELPMSWLEPHHRQTINLPRHALAPQLSIRPIHIRENGAPYQVLPRVEQLPYGTSGHQVQLGNAIGEVVDIPDAELQHRRHHHYVIKNVPYGLMQRMNPNMYAPMQVIGNNGREVSWTDYSSLRPGHRHYHQMNPCHHHPCLNHGHCHFSHHPDTGYYHFKCGCNKGFQGHYCEVSPYSCHPSPCRHGGTCTKTKSLVFCTCLSDYKGHHCEVEKACLDNPCFNDGICHETATSYHCECSQGWRGKSCEERVLLCETKPCKNGGTCHDLEDDGRFECTCPTGFGCVDCSCPMEGITSPSLLTDQHPADQAFNPQDEHALTQGTTNGVITTSSHEVCPPTFCHNGGTCIKGPHGYLCNCAIGFHGLYCDVPDLCTPNPCQNNGVCLQDGDENYKCICPYGYKGTDCQLQLSCSGHPCMNGGKCVETADSYQCKCSTGYKGVKCTDLSPCSHNPCLHKGSCFEKGSMYTCQCKKGYRGRTCQEKDPCFPNPCGVNGQCLERSGEVMCKCEEGWMGEFCAVEDLCHRDNHCINGGTCVHHLAEFKCFCPEGFHGDNCELRQSCFDNPCQNGGICEEADDSFVCKCLDGYHGEKCHLESHCYPSPCSNEGVCYESKSTFVCECKHGFIGKMCQEQKFCISNPCLNGGHCTEVDDVFRCKCPLGFFGRICDVNVCDHNPCRNGGTCMPSNNEVGYTCECVFPYHGRQCDEIDTCVPNPCRHGGTCQSHLQHIQDVSFHEGPQFHGTDESVISIVGPIYNETIHHEPYYNLHEHTMEFVPDEHVMSNEVHHFHMTSDVADHVYEDEIYHGKNVERYHHDHDYLGGHHNGLRPNHHLIDNLAAGGHNVDEINEINKREHVWKINAHNNRTKRQFISKPFNKKTKKTVLQRNELSSIDRVPQFILKIRDGKTSKVIKRTIHDLYVCQCRVGFLGAHCQHLNPCETNPCHNDGICVPRGELYQCKCVNGYGGANCDDPHPCLPNPCLHSGKCLLARNTHGYLCECGTEWRGQNCESRDLCSLHNPCLHGGICVNADETDKVICKCRARFTGDRCEVDKCADCDANAYCHHGSCLCKPDFVGNGYKCRAIGDVCEPNPCENGGLCKHGMDGSLFSCDCPHGFLGPRCELPNPCVNAPCLHNGACIDESSSKEKGILMADRHDYKCFCTPGYRGRNCEETNLAACSSGPCNNNGFCFDASSESHKRHLVHADDYECFCPPGFSGKDCEYEHYPCVSSPCMNGGHCLDAQKLPAVSFDAHGYKCSCNRGFAGRNCEVTVDGLGACHSNPCMHDGRCVDIINNNDPDLHFDYDHEFKCFCSAVYSGVLCEVPYPACHSQPCQHNGTCHDKSNNIDLLYDETGYECKCSPGFEGKNCERQYALNVLDDNNFDHALTEAAVFDHLHPGHPEHDNDGNGDILENIGHSFDPHNPLEETSDPSNHHLADNLEDEDPFHGAQVLHVTHEKKPMPVKISEVKVLDEKLPTKLKIVDHKLNEAHGKLIPEHVILPTPSTPTHDSVAHHPRISGGQKFDFPIRNPSPTSPIVLSANLLGEPSFDGETKIAADQNRLREIAGSARSGILFQNNDKKDKIESKGNQLNTNKKVRVIYGAHGRRSGIAKKK